MIFAEMRDAARIINDGLYRVAIAIEAATARRIEPKDERPYVKLNCPQCDWSAPLVIAQLGEIQTLADEVRSKPAGFRCICPMCETAYCVTRAGVRVEPVRERKQVTQQRPPQRDPVYATAPPDMRTQWERKEPE